MEEMPAPYAQVQKVELSTDLFQLALRWEAVEITSKKLLGRSIRSKVAIVAVSFE